MTNPHSTRIETLQSVETAQQGRFTSPGWPNDHYQLRSLDRKTYTIQNSHLPEALRQIVDCYQLSFPLFSYPFGSPFDRRPLTVPLRSGA